MDDAERKIHHRRSLRLPGYDDSQPGAYFVTVVTHGRPCLFGEVVDGEMILNAAGKVVEAAWRDLPVHYPGVELGAFCIMPNPIHAIIILVDMGTKIIPVVEAGLRPASTAAKNYPLSEIVRAFKSFSARRINQIGNTPGQPVWQRNDYEHILRNDDDYRLIHLYIQASPARRPRFFSDLRPFPAACARRPDPVC
jgi:REP element-mobilizing transposase RayT